MLKITSNSQVADNSSSKLSSTQKTNNSIHLAELWLRRVRAHSFGTLDSLKDLQELRSKVHLISEDVRLCIEPVINVLDELFQRGRLFSPELEPAIQRSFENIKQKKS